MTAIDKRDQRKGSSLAVWLVVAGVVLLPVAYILSIGPAAWLDVNHCVSHNAYMIAYWPIDRACEFCAPLGDAVGYYERLWLRLPMRASGPPPEIQDDEATLYIQTGP